MFDIIGIGECLVDCLATPRDGMVAVEGNAGGAPANVLAMAAKMGLDTALVARVGDDVFGKYLRDTVRSAGVDDRFMTTDDARPTTLAVVSLDDNGNRSFGFYRSDTADVALDVGDIPGDVERCRLLHFGSVSLTAEPSRSATLAAVRRAKDAGVAISCDPNLRPLLWVSEDEAQQWIERAIGLSDYVKISDEELEFLVGGGDIEDGIETLWGRYQLRLLCVTRGNLGCVCRTSDGVFYSKAYAVDTIDTTGAGDAFWGAMLYKLLSGTGGISEWLDFANAAGSLSTAKKGAIRSYPCGGEICELMRAGAREE